MMDSPVKDILVVGPNAWDREELLHPRRRARYRFHVLEEGALLAADDVGLWNVLKPFNVLAFIDRAVQKYRGRVDGVLATDEFGACAVGAAIARALGLPGPAPDAVLRCQHKYHARLAGRASIPEATPGFALIDPFRLEPPDLPFPMFVKPVRATSSVLARRVANFEELRAFARFSFLQRSIARKVLRPFRKLAERYGGFEAGELNLLGEECLEGALVTVEGFSAGGEVEVYGIVDSAMYPGTETSFQRFDYPSRLPPEVQERMAGIAARFVRGLGLDVTVFNIEMFWNPDRDAIHVVEINPRLCYQFADLHEKVDGFNPYEFQLALAVGERPRLTRGGGRHRAAASFALRRFRPSRIVRMPGPGHLAAVREVFPDARVRLYGRPGRAVPGTGLGVESYRYAILNLGGESREDLDARRGETERRLPFVFR